MARAEGSRPKGYLVETGPDQAPKEADTFTCQHCCKIVIVRPFCSPSDIEFGGQCKGCMGLICLTCYNKPGCDHIEKKLERAESSARFRASMGH
jgi:hypothetical protein